MVANVCVSLDVRPCLIHGLCLNVLHRIRFRPWNLFMFCASEGLIRLGYSDPSSVARTKADHPEGLRIFQSLRQSLKQSRLTFFSAPWSVNRLFETGFYWKAASLDSNSTFKRHNGFFFPRRVQNELLLSVTTTVMKVKGCFSLLRRVSIRRWTPPRTKVYVSIFFAFFSSLFRRSLQRPCGCTPHMLPHSKAVFPFFFPPTPE